MVKLSNDVDEHKDTHPEYGVSYIDGDPCGSKYNDDPFDTKLSSKPGMPDDMKERIKALSEAKKLEYEQEKKGDDDKWT